MSREGVDQILEQALADQTFRTRLFADPRKVCASFSITDDEFRYLLGDAISKPRPKNHPQPAR